MSEPCTHADAGEANKRFRRDAEEAWNRYLDADDETPEKDAARRQFYNARHRLYRITRCPACGRWREGER